MKLEFYQYLGKVIDKGYYDHKDQVGFYGNVNKNEDCYMECEASDSEEVLGSEQFRKR